MRDVLWWCVVVSLHVSSFVYRGSDALILQARAKVSHVKMAVKRTKWLDEDPAVNIATLLHVEDIICFINKQGVALRLGLVSKCFQGGVQCTQMVLDEDDFQIVKTMATEVHDAHEIVSNDQILGIVATNEVIKKDQGRVGERCFELVEIPWTAIEVRLSTPFEAQEEEENVFVDKIHQSWRLKDDRLLYSLYKNGASVEYLMKRMERGRQGVLRRIQHIEDPSHNAHVRYFGISDDDDESEFGLSNDENSQSFIGTHKARPLKPIKEVKIRLIYGMGPLLSDFSFGYMDRFEGIKECPANSCNSNIKGKERLLLKAMPDHRIEYVKYKERVIWHKKERLDLIFGSGPNELSNNYRLSKVVEEYDSWWEAVQKQRKLSDEQELFQVDGGDHHGGYDHRSDGSSGGKARVGQMSDELYDDSLLIDEDEFMRGF